MEPSGGRFFVGPDSAPDKYELLEKVGGGGEAELWRAALTVVGAEETVAVKILRGERMNEFEALSARWAEQAEMLRFVNQPGVVGVREHFEGPPRHAAGAAQGGERALYLVMNWVEGRSLGEWVMLHPGLHGVLDGLRHLEQVAGALEALHDGPTPSRRPVVHGDLSPNNVMITDRHGAVLVDFGLVRLTGHYTQQAAGTPGYAAPEVWTHGEYSKETDRYSFGALTYFAVVGEAPPASRREIRMRLFAQPVLERCPPDKVEFVMRMFSDDPRERPGPVEWIGALRQGATASARSVVQGAVPTQGGPGAATGRVPGPSVRYAVAAPTQVPPRDRPQQGPPPGPPPNAPYIPPAYSPPPGRPAEPSRPRRSRFLVWTVVVLAVVVALLAAFIGGSIANRDTAGGGSGTTTTVAVPTPTVVAPAPATSSTDPGFLPLPTPVTPAVSRSSGAIPLALSDGYEADLDSQSPNWDVAQTNDNADIMNSGASGADLFGQSGVDLAPVTGPAEYATCQTATAYTGYVQELRVGQAFCVRTDQNGRFAYVKVRATDPVLSLDVVVW